MVMLDGKPPTRAPGNSHERGGESWQTHGRDILPGGANRWHSELRSPPKHAATGVAGGMAISDGDTRVINKKGGN